MTESTFHAPNSGEISKPLGDANKVGEFDAIREETRELFLRSLKEEENSSSPLPFPMSSTMVTRMKPLPLILS